MVRGQPDERTVHAAVALATRAPSIHNTQPWLFRVADRSIHLFADRTRWLAASDPEGRDLLVSCGAALHHLRTAFAALGWSTTVHRLPNPAQPDHLAAVEPHRQRALAEGSPALSAAIARRRTDRRVFAHRAVPAELTDDLRTAAAAEGAQLVVVTDRDDRLQLASAIAKAELLEEYDLDRWYETQLWSGMLRGATAGVPAANVPAYGGRYADVTMRRFGGADLAPTTASPAADGSTLMVLATSTDGPLDQLRAGESLSAVLLAATEAGLATCPLSQAVEIDAVRTLVRTRVLHQSGHPQIVLRVGWAPTGDPLPPTPRRPVDEVLAPLSGTTVPDLGLGRAGGLSTPRPSP